MEGIKAEHAEDRPSHWRSYVTVLAASMLHLSTGAVIGWASPVLPHLDITVSQRSLVGSLYSLGAAPGPFIVTMGLDTIGRKGIIYILWGAFMISWLILVFTDNVYAIFVARFIGGIGVGGASAGIPVYIAEIALPEIRGRLGAMILLAQSSGSLIMFYFGPRVSYTVLAVIGGILCAIFVVFFYFVPESPYYYYKKGKKKEAEEAVQKLRGYKTREKLEEEMEEIEKTILAQKKNSISFFVAIKQRAALKALGIGLFIMAIQQFQGINPINTYTQTVFETAQLSFDASNVPVINLFIGMLFLILPVLMVNKCFGVKTAYIISGIGTAISLALLAFYFYLIEQGGVDMHDYSYLSIVFLTLMSLFNHIGLAPLSWPIIAELLPLSVKGIGTGICGSVSSLLGFVLLALFPIVADHYGYATDFLVFAVLLMVSTIIAMFVIPDTTGKTLQEIQELLSK